MLSLGYLFKVILGPVVFALGFLISNAYRLLFGWWLDPYTERKLDERFASQIRQKVPFVFAQYGAQVVPTEGPSSRGMDAAYVTIEAGNLRLRFITALGDLVVQIAPKCSPADWHELALVAMVMETPRGIGPREKIPALEEVAKLLHSKWEGLNESLSPGQYPIIRQRLLEIYDLPGDDLWYAGIIIPRHLRTASSRPIAAAWKR